MAQHVQRWIEVTPSAGRCPTSPCSVWSKVRPERVAGYGHGVRAACRARGQRAGRVPAALARLPLGLDPCIDAFVS